MERPVIRGNAMFRVGINSDLNACVGNNGFPNIYTYQEGYHDAAITLIKAAKHEIYNVDGLVYPILFCARHAVELFLKKQIYVLSDVQAIKQNKNIENLLITNHSLNDLWDTFKSLATDKRYDEYTSALEEYIKYFSEVDDTGQTFRYPTDVEGARHLTEYGCINISIFEEKYLLMHEIIDDLVYLTDYLKSEYAQKSFVKELSREQIYAIAQRLPNRDDWCNEDFAKAKKEILSEYIISGNTFSETLDMIQQHREFISYIGRELPIAEISLNKLKLFIKIYNKYRERLGKADFIDVLNDYTNEVCDKLSQDNICAVSALFNISFYKLFSEEYDTDFKSKKENKEIFDIVFDDLSVARGNVLKHINNGLKKLGQKTLLTAFD